MMSLNELALNNVDSSVLNLNKNPAQKWVVEFAFGRNLNAEIFLDRVKSDWNQYTNPEHHLSDLSTLTQFMLGVYKAVDRQLVFNKPLGAGGYAASLVYRPGGEAYGLAYLMPKRILSDPTSMLNRSEGCSDIHNMESAQNHYWQRQIRIEPFKAEGSPIREYPKINGSTTLDCAWMYEAAASKVAPPGNPSKDYVKNIINGLTYQGVELAPKSYMDYLKSFL